jgi:hypothetical protein
MKFGAVMNHERVKYFCTKHSFMLNVTHMLTVPDFETVSVTLFSWGGTIRRISQLIIYNSEINGNDSSIIA